MTALHASLTPSHSPPYLSRGPEFGADAPQRLEERLNTLHEGRSIAPIAPSPGRNVPPPNAIRPHGNVGAPLLSFHGIAAGDTSRAPSARALPSETHIAPA